LAADRDQDKTQATPGTPPLSAFTLALPKSFPLTETRHPDQTGSAFEGNFSDKKRSQK